MSKSEGTEPTFVALDGTLPAPGLKRDSFPPNYGGVGLIIIQRLHRLVRHGFRPWLGYSVASLEDQDIHLRREGMKSPNVAVIEPDGSVWFISRVLLKYPRLDTEGVSHSEASAIFADDTDNFDALFPVAAITAKGGLVTRLYEAGF